MDSIHIYFIESIKHNNDTYQNTTHPYPCCICQKTVNQNQKAIECNNCNHRNHIKYNGTSVAEYNLMIKNINETEIENNDSFCNKCQILKAAQTFPFGLKS